MPRPRASRCPPSACRSSVASLAGCRALQDAQGRERRRAELRTRTFHDGAATTADVPKIAGQVEAQVAPRRFTQFGAAPKFAEPAKRQGRQKSGESRCRPATRSPRLGPVLVGATRPRRTGCGASTPPMPPARSAARCSWAAGIGGESASSPGTARSSLPCRRPESGYWRAEKARNLPFTARSSMPAFFPSRNLSIRAPEREVRGDRASRSQTETLAAMRHFPGPTTPRARFEKTRDGRFGGTERKSVATHTSTTSPGWVPTRFGSSFRGSSAIHPSCCATPLRRTQNQTGSHGGGSQGIC